MADEINIGAAVHAVDVYGRYELGKAVERRGDSYLVRWKGFAESENSYVDKAWVRLAEPGKLVQMRGEYISYIFCCCFYLELAF